MAGFRSNLLVSGIHFFLVSEKTRVRAFFGRKQVWGKEIQHYFILFDLA